MFYHPPKTPVKPDKRSETAWNASRLGWLTLASFDGFGSRTLAKLRSRYGTDGSKALAVDRETLELCGCRKKTIAAFFTYRQTTNPTDLALLVEKEGIRFVLIDDDEYPPLLQEIADPPGALFLRGGIYRKNTECVALVGTRSITPYGKTVTAELCRELVCAGYGIVSGLALGVDAVTHEHALDASGYCVAVLGGGVDANSIYPRSNADLAERILEHGGTILSEYPPYSESLKHHFPLRNRIIAGLSRATVVVEAAEHSGSLITAHQALEQNREVFSVPGPILSEQSKGTNALLRLGAIPCTGVHDILTVLRGTTEPEPVMAQQVTDEEGELLDALEYPMHLDDIARALAQDVPAVSSRLIHLELKGLITDQGGKIYARSGRWKSGGCVDKTDVVW